RIKKTDLLKIIGKDNYGNHIVLLIPCFIVTSGADPEKLLRYAIYMLDPIVKENYVLILCETHTNWLTSVVYTYAKQWYETLPRIYKKNLKKLYFVHSGFLSKSILTIMTPFISVKFWKKVEYIEKLEDLFLKLSISPNLYLKHFPYIVQRNEELILGEKEPINLFNADLEILCQRLGKPFNGFKHIPSILVDFLTHLSKDEIIVTKDLFYLQTDAASLYEIVGDIEYGEPTTDFNNLPSLVCSFRLFLDTQKFGLLGKDAFTILYHMNNTKASDNAIKYNIIKLYNKLQPGVKDCVLCLLLFFQHVSTYFNENNMTVETLATIFTPTFFRPKIPSALFSECIPLANKCTQMIIQKPQILLDPVENYIRTKSDLSDSSSETSYETNTSISSDKVNNKMNDKSDTTSDSYTSESNKIESNKIESNKIESNKIESDIIINNLIKRNVVMPTFHNSGDNNISNKNYSVTHNNIINKSTGNYKQNNIIKLDNNILENSNIKDKNKNVDYNKNQEENKKLLKSSNEKLNLSVSESSSSEQKSDESSTKSESLENDSSSSKFESGSTDSNSSSSESIKKKKNSNLSVNDFPKNKTPEKKPNVKNVNVKNVNEKNVNEKKQDNEALFNISSSIHNY
ncbi:rhoGAP GTPase, putative, partial [Hepatocystis sp. ex Piliocolobus tephrosceles]